MRKGVPVEHALLASDLHFFNFTAFTSTRVHRDVARNVSRCLAMTTG